MFLVSTFAVMSEQPSSFHVNDKILWPLDDLNSWLIQATDLKFTVLMLFKFIMLEIELEQICIDRSELILSKIHSSELSNSFKLSLVTSYTKQTARVNPENFQVWKSAFDVSWHEIYCGISNCQCFDLWNRLDCRSIPVNNWWHWSVGKCWNNRTSSASGQTLRCLSSARQHCCYRRTFLSSLNFE